MRTDGFLVVISKTPGEEVLVSYSVFDHVIFVVKLDYLFLMRFLYSWS